MTPTEHEMTIAVDAAARHAWDTMAQKHGRHDSWESLQPLEKNYVREDVLGPVVAALQALPDRAATERIRIGTYLTDNMWCHHEGCDMDQGPCSCGLDELLEQLGEASTR